MREHSHTWEVIPWRVFLASMMHGYETPDGYEPDNTLETGKFIQLGETQMRNFAPYMGTNTDFIKFEVVKPARPEQGIWTYRIEIIPNGVAQHSGAVYCVTGCGGETYRRQVASDTRTINILLSHNSLIDNVSVWALELYPERQYMSPSQYLLRFTRIENHWNYQSTLASTSSDESNSVWIEIPTR